MLHNIISFLTSISHKSFLFWFKSPFFYLVRDTISESLSDFLLKSQIPAEALWSLRSIDLRVIVLHPSFVNSCMPQNSSLVPLTSEPIRVNVFSFVIIKGGIHSIPKNIISSYNFSKNSQFSSPPYYAYVSPAIADKSMIFEICVVFGFRVIIKSVFSKESLL